MLSLVASRERGLIECRRQNPTSKHYDYRLIYERLRAIIEAREDDDILGLVSLLRSGLVRNLGNITAPRLFNRAYAGTKLLIEDYITQVALAIDYLTSYPTSANSDTGLTSQAKLDVLHDTRQAFGRSGLVLQGGAIFGLCHIGVVKALHLRGLLPRIIVGTATGALIAALVGVHTEDELLDFLQGTNIDLSAFSALVDLEKEGRSDNLHNGWLATLLRRTKRFLQEGYFLDIGVLEQVVRANVGDLTFEEAYTRTKRVLNITVSTSGGGGVPNLLNYLTAPNVVRLHHIIFQIWNQVLTATVNLARRPCLQRLHLRPLPPRPPPLQRRKRQHNPLGPRRRSHLPPLDAPNHLHRPRIPAPPHRRTLQRKPLHRLSGASVPRPLPPL